MARGRPRSRAIDDAVTDAVRQLLDEVGYQGLSIDRVAARAGVGKAGIYRRWRSKAEMVFACVIHGMEITPPPALGSLRADLAAVVEQILVVLSGPSARQAVPGLVADTTSDPELAARFAATFIRRERAILSALLDRAVARGEIGDVDPAFVHAQLLGAVFAWLFLLSAEPPPDLPARLADSVAASLTAKD
jgi:AcrR family transcriptional regulator